MCGWVQRNKGRKNAKVRKWKKKRDAREMRDERNQGRKDGGSY